MQRMARLAALVPAQDMVRCGFPIPVMPGLVPGIHVLEQKKSWMAGSSPSLTKRNSLHFSTTTSLICMTGAMSV